MTREFNCRIASVCGVNAAVVAHSIYLSLNEDTLSSEVYEGDYWCRCSIKTFTADLPCLTYSMVETALEKLLKAGIIRKRCLNKDRFDHTSWYNFTDYGYQFYE